MVWPELPEKSLTLLLWLLGLCGRYCIYLVGRLVKEKMHHKIVKLWFSSVITDLSYISFLFLCMWLMLERSQFIFEISCTWDLNPAGKSMWLPWMKLFKSCLRNILAWLREFYWKDRIIKPSVDTQQVITGQELSQMFCL